MTYIDTDKRIAAFFDDKKVIKYIEANKRYDDNPVITAIMGDFSDKLPLEENTFDILFSFYAGFISQSCKKYLRKGGILICNNSHGDASIAYTDLDYKFIAVIKRNNDRFTISDKNLEEYFIKKDKSPIDIKKVLAKMTGENFTKKAYAYIFTFSPMIRLEESSSL
ncbi:class I SAM-dependent methyltransferase [Spirochaetia bacterium 38H-sp]|uniref:Class I SAM-dependent methyltransferase n=1 Tax=Rarispira pelagica TaxID=3141764 RepID=A0ABU9UD53_9SPIR